MAFQTGLRFFGVAPLLLLASSLSAQTVVRPANFSPANFSIDTRLVLVPVTVTDNYGKTILGLKATDFNVFDDQTPQRIVSFSREDVPASVGLVLDVSGSMQKALGLVKSGASALVREANPEDEFLLLTVATLPGTTSEFTSDAADLLAQINFTKPGGLTALIDTVHVGLEQMRDARHPQRALVILSDGMDNHSRYSQAQLLKAALEADVQIYTVILDGMGDTSSGTIPFRPSMIAKPGDRGAQQQGPELLEKLADKTGGLHFHARNPKEAAEAIAKVGEALRNQYVLGYQPATSGPAGKLHRIHVTATAPTKVYIHARTGYYAP